MSIIYFRDVVIILEEYLISSSANEMIRVDVIREVAQFTECLLEKEESIDARVRETISRSREGVSVVEKYFRINQCSKRGQILNFLMKKV